MEVELVTIHPYSRQTGIGRYVHGLQDYLGPGISMQARRPSFPLLASRLSTLTNLPTGIRDRRPGSIVHFPQIMGCAMMLLNPQRPAVATVHDLGILELPEEWNSLDPLSRFTLRLSLSGLKRVDRVIADSEFTRRGLIGRVGLSPEKVVTVYPGIDPTIFKSHFDARARLGHKYPYLAACDSPWLLWLLYVGSELPRKNLAVLLKALSTLEKKFPGLVLLKVGQAGGQRFRTQTKTEVRRLGLEGKVFFFDDVDDDELALFYSAADLLVQPSKMEGFGFPVLEAMACGTPVISSNAGSLPEVAGDAAVMVRPDDIAGLAEAMANVLDNRELRDELAVRGLERGRLFSWDSTATATEAVYREMVN